MKTKKKKQQKKRMTTSNSGARSLKENFPLYIVLDSKVNKNNKQRKKLINSLGNKEMKGIEYLTNSFLQNKYKVDGIKLSKLRKDKKFIYNLANGRIPLNSKKKILVQKGGMLGSLLSLALGGLMGGGGKKSQSGGIFPFLPAIASKMLLPLAGNLIGKIAEPILNTAISKM